MDLKITSKADSFNLTLPQSKSFLVNNEPICTLPVGTILEFVEDISPAQVFGGTWLRFGEGRVTVGYSKDSKFNWTKQTSNLQSDESNITYNIGGEEEHTLTESEMPQHDHKKGFSSFNYINGQPIVFSSNCADGQDNCYVVNGSSATCKLTDSNMSTININGESKPHNNMPPYIVVYRWVRTA